MDILGTIKGLLESESDPVTLYNCNDCSNLFTRAESTGSEEEIRCPNCESADVEPAASAS